MIPRSYKIAPSSLRAVLMLAGGSPVASASCCSVAGSPATNRIASSRLRRLGKGERTFFRRALQRDVAKCRRLRENDLPGTYKFQHGQECHNDLQRLAIGDERKKLYVAALLQRAHEVAHLDDDRKCFALDDHRAGSCRVQCLHERG